LGTLALAALGRSPPSRRKPHRRPPLPLRLMPTPVLEGRYRLDADLDAARAVDDLPGLALFYGGLVRKKNMLST
jgi:hypothetical protein